MVPFIFSLFIQFLKLSNNVFDDRTNSSANIITVCGENQTDADFCHCFQFVNELHCFRSPANSSSISVENTFLKILDDTFVPKSVKFDETPIEILKKNKILPGKENIVQKLRFFDNYMKSIENGTFEKFMALKSLKIQCNELTEFPAEIWGTNIPWNLTELDLTDNIFPNISAISFDHLKNLTCLILNMNEKLDFSSEKAVFPKELENLKILELDRCNITTLNKKIFVNLKNLKELVLSGNPLKSIPTAFKLLPNLQILNLEHSRIETLQSFQFAANPLLKNLNIQSSHLLKIESCTFCNLTKLSRLNLSHNSELSEIPEDAFGDKIRPKFEWFYISSCNISTLSPRLINWQESVSIQIDENPFNCNCSLAWMIEEIAPKNGTLYKNLENKRDLKCKFSSNLEGKLFYNLKIDKKRESCIYE